MLSNIVVALDVSKDKSFARAYARPGKKLSSSISFRHDPEGFSHFLEFLMKVEKENGERPDCVLEHTGVYHLVVVSVLQEAGYSVYAVSPLQSSTVRRALNPKAPKTDALDPDYIATAHFLERSRKIPADDRYQRAKLACRAYLEWTNEVRRIKCRVSMLASLVWPSIESSGGFTDYQLLVMEAVGTPGQLKSIRLSTVVKKALKLTDKASEARLFKTAQGLLNRCVSAVGDDSYAVEDLKQNLAALRQARANTEAALARMKEGAEEELEILESIPMVGEVTACVLLSEIGDISRFPTPKSLVSYCGLDPAIMQSGTSSGEHLHITKKGNKALRQYLYLVVKNMIMHGCDNRITRFYRHLTDREKAATPVKVAAVACCAKLARVIWKLLSSRHMFIALEQ